MVKNSSGGKHKNNARKDFAANSTASGKKTSTAMNESEAYAQVIKLLGGGMCTVVLEDGRDMLCILRGRFMGKFKRSHRIEKGTFVLVQLRDWERKGQEKKVDLEHVYLAHDVDFLQRLSPTFFRNDGLINGSTDAAKLSTLPDDDDDPPPPTTE